MKLRLRYFAAVREALGRAEEQLEFSAPPVDVQALLAVVDRSGRVARDRLRVAVNGEIRAIDAPLALFDGDEVALLPPVTGG